MNALPKRRHATAVALALAVGALAAPAASAYPADPEGDRLVVPKTSPTPAETAQPKAAKPAKSAKQRPIAPRPKPPLEP
jgi:hypothetical protein